MVVITFMGDTGVGIGVGGGAVVSGVEGRVGVCKDPSDIFQFKHSRDLLFGSGSPGPGLKSQASR